MAIPNGSKALYETHVQAIMDLIASKQAGEAPEDYDAQFNDLIAKISCYEDIVNWQGKLAASQTE